MTERNVEMLTMAIIIAGYLAKGQSGDTALENAIRIFELLNKEI